MTGWKYAVGPAVTERQIEQLNTGYEFQNAGFPRVAPHDESEWRWWLIGWDMANAEKELDERMATDDTNDNRHPSILAPKGGFASNEVSEPEVQKTAIAWPNGCVHPDRCNWRVCRHGADSPGKCPHNATAVALDARP